MAPLTPHATRTVGEQGDLRVRGRTRSQAAQLAPVREMASQPPSPVPEGASLPPVSRDRHSLGLLSLANGDVWNMIRATEAEVKRQRLAQQREQGGAEESKGEVVPEDLVSVGGGWSVGPAAAGVPLAMAARFTSREEIDTALLDQEPPFKQPDLPLRQAHELVVPNSYNEMLRNEHSAHFLDGRSDEGGVRVAAG